MMVIIILYVITRYRITRIERSVKSKLKIDRQAELRLEETLNDLKKNHSTAGNLEIISPQVMRNSIKNLVPSSTLTIHYFSMTQWFKGLRA